MRLEELGEFGFIQRIARLVGASAPPVVVGVGDDAAVLKLSADEYLLVTTDAVVENEHFRRQWLTAQQIGARAASAGLSDIAAMGGRPLAALVSAGLPPSLEAAAAEQLMQGLVDTFGRHDTPLVGGDTTASPSGIFLDVVVLGTAGGPWLRSTARPGDALLVTGSLGAAVAALELLRSGAVEDASALPAPLAARFAGPTPRLAVAAALRDLDAVDGALDISDGLVQDAGHLARASAVAVTIEAGRVPISEACRRVAEQLGHDALQWALTSGEEYELLLAVRPHRIEEVVEVARTKADSTLTHIGHIADGEGVTIVDEAGQPVAVTQRGWDHLSR